MIKAFSRFTNNINVENACSIYLFADLTCVITCDAKMFLLHKTWGCQLKPNLFTLNLDLGSCTYILTCPLVLVNMTGKYK